MQYAEEGVLRAAEREECHRCYDTDVDSDIAADNPVAELAGAGAVRGKNCIAVTIGAGVAGPDGFVQIFRPQNTHYRTKDFFPADLHIGSGIFEDGGTQETGVRILSINF